MADSKLGLAASHSFNTSQASSSVRDKGPFERERKLDVIVTVKISFILCESSSCVDSFVRTKRFDRLVRCVSRCLEVPLFVDKPSLKSHV
ncbi:hypothetical protein NPIL_638391 [Nephila pilipes]|uniref:Uncharacterized protein n=1 Tax=Nephila pilipes TaxID=299642 RepID=A0A8X6MXS6_NEPPI|nr:hypothetical protein NPIL_638391 [Nephila pilipes]